MNAPTTDYQTSAAESLFAGNENNSSSSPVLEVEGAHQTEFYVNQPAVSSLPTPVTTSVLNTFSQNKIPLNHQYHSLQVQQPHQNTPSPAFFASKRLYRTDTDSNKWVTRDIAALDFLLGIPLEAEAEIVHTGWLLEQKQLTDVLNDDDDEEDINDQTDPVRQTRRGGALGTPLARSSVNIHTNHLFNHSSLQSHGRWWEKFVKPHINTLGDSIGGQKTHLHGRVTASNIADPLEGPTTEDKGVAIPIEESTHHHHNQDAEALVFTSENAIASSNKKSSGVTSASHHHASNSSAAVVAVFAPPGRRLDGDKAIYIQIPLTTTTMTKQRLVARWAALREWELQTAHGVQPLHKHQYTQSQKVRFQGSLTQTPEHQALPASQSTTGKQQHSVQSQPSLLDGRIFFSAGGSYPMSVFSLVRYEPRKEEAILRRQKLEARGGGGSQFIISPARRDWRGISYRALLPRVNKTKEHKAFNKFLHANNNGIKKGITTTITTSGATDVANNETAVSKGKSELDMMDDDDDSVSSGSSTNSDVYVPGLLDDPKMVLGRHRNIMIGDRVTGPIVSSTIQFVDPAILKADLNKQFRERFDGWEPPKSARKYIGARVIQGTYVLMDPAEQPYDEDEESIKSGNNTAATMNQHQKKVRQGSVTSITSAIASESGGTNSKEKQIRMPPSLTLSKIRSLKHQAWHATMAGRLEIATLSLACVYFERLCLDCRVDKSNRRLAFASCLLLATKLNEPNVGLVMRQETDLATNRIQSLIRPNKRSTTMFASLLEFFTQEWNLTLKNLFDAEWGVFVALGFSLHATPSQVAFHFKRFLKTLGWNARTYLGDEMYNCWQDVLEDEEHRRQERERKSELRRQKKEEQLLNFHIEIEQEMRRKAKEKDDYANAATDTMDIQNIVVEVPADELSNVTDNNGHTLQLQTSPRRNKRGATRSIFHRFGMRRAVSQERLNQLSQTERPASTIRTTRRNLGSFTGNGDSAANIGIKLSPSMPVLNGTFLPLNNTNTSVDYSSNRDSHNNESINSIGDMSPVVATTPASFAIDIPNSEIHSDTSTIGSFAASEMDGLVV